MLQWCSEMRFKWPFQADCMQDPPAPRAYGRLAHAAASIAMRMGEDVDSEEGESTQNTDCKRSVVVLSAARWNSSRRTLRRRCPRSRLSTAPKHRKGWRSAADADADAWHASESCSYPSAVMSLLVPLSARRSGRRNANISPTNEDCTRTPESSSPTRMLH